MEAKTEWKIEGGHTLQPHSLVSSDNCPPPTPNFRFFFWDREGAQKCFILRNQTTGDLKSHHLQARITLTSLSMPPEPHFLSAELWVIRYHLASILCVFPITHYRTNNAQFFRAHSLLGESPSLGPALHGLKRTGMFTRKCHRIPL